MKYWAKAIFFDALLAGVLYAWLALGFEGAGRVAIFYIWTVMVLRVLVGLVANKAMFKEVRPKGFIVYHALTNVAVIGLLAWIERPVLAALAVVGFIAMEAAREREPKAAAIQEAKEGV